MGRLVDIKLCPLRANPNPFTGKAEFEECYEEKCMLYNQETKQCGLVMVVKIQDKKDN